MNDGKVSRVPTTGNFWRGSSCCAAKVRDVVFKVIIGVGRVKSPELIRKASLLSMLAGSRFK